MWRLRGRPDQYESGEEVIRQLDREKRLELCAERKGSTDCSVGEEWRLAEAVGHGI